MITRLSADLRQLADSSRIEALHARARPSGPSGGHVYLTDARAQFARVEPELYRFPAIDPGAFRAAVAESFGG